MVINGAGHLFDPSLIIQIPFYSLHDTNLELRFRIPTQSIGNLGRVYGITLVMAETVFYKSNQVFVYPTDVNLSVFACHLLLQHPAILRFLRHQAVDSGDGQLHDFKVCLLVMTAHVVDFSFDTFANHQVDGFTVVFYIEPVAHVASVTIYGKLLAFQNVLDDERYQLLGEMVGTVVVGTAGDGYRHLVRIVIRHHYHVGTGFRGTVGAMRAERCLFRKVSFGS